MSSEEKVKKVNEQIKRNLNGKEDSIKIPVSYMEEYKKYLIEKFS